MLFNVPQYIDIEDKIVGPLTAKQLLWMIGMGGTLLVLWAILEKTAFFFSAIPVILIFVALAFYRPHNQPLSRFIGLGFVYFLHPKIYFWKREAEELKKTSGEGKKKEAPGEQGKKISADDLEVLARTLDSEGRERSERVMQLIKERRKKNS